MKAQACYKATVNEPETITDAKPFYAVRDETSALRARGPGFPATAHVERS
jgi:hypothetical protein